MSHRADGLNDIFENNVQMKSAQVREMLSFNGLTGNVTIANGAYTIQPNDFNVICTVAGVSIILPKASENKGRIINIKATFAGFSSVTITTVAGGGLIEGETTQSLYSRASYTFQSSGTAWEII